MTEISLHHAVFTGIDDDRIAATEQALSTFTMAGLSNWARERTVVHELAGQRFRMLVDPGEDPDVAVVVGGEYGNGLGSVGGIARALVARELVNPNASLVLQPNTAVGEPNANFSRDEQRVLRRGSAGPLVDRIRTTLDKSGDPGNLTLYGPSQGGVAMLAFGAHPGVPASAVAIIETPNVLDRSHLSLVKDFVGVGAELKANILSNFEDDAVLGKELVADLSVRGLARYGLGLALPDNRALLGIIRRATAAGQMQAILAKGGSVAHAWATGDAVSPEAANVAIAAELSVTHLLRYGAYSFENDHSVTNVYLPNAALAFQARHMLDNPLRHD